MIKAAARRTQRPPHQTHPPTRDAPPPHLSTDTQVPEGDILQTRVMRLTRAVGHYVSRYDRGTFAIAIAIPYALLVIAATVYVEISTRQPGSQGLEALVVFAVTFPSSELLMLLPLATLPPVTYWLFPAAGLFQAWLLWLIARGRRKNTPPAGALRLQDDRHGQERAP
jgi:hypothetical protein